MDKRETEAIKIIERIITLINNKSEKDKFLDDFSLECSWIKQEVETHRLTLPLNSIDGFKIGYIIAEDYFENDLELKTLTEELYDQFVDYEDY